MHDGVKHAMMNKSQNAAASSAKGVLSMKAVLKPEEKSMEKIVALCKTRGFIFPGSDIYGGLANTWDYGPLGAWL